MSMVDEVVRPVVRRWKFQVSMLHGGMVMKHGLAPSSFSSFSMLSMRFVTRSTACLLSSVKDTSSNICFCLLLQSTNATYVALHVISHSPAINTRGIVMEWDAFWQVWWRPISRSPTSLPPPPPASQGVGVNSSVLSGCPCPCLTQGWCPWWETVGSWQHDCQS